MKQLLTFLCYKVKVEVGGKKWHSGECADPNSAHIMPSINPKIRWIRIDNDLSIGKVICWLVCVCDRQRDDYIITSMLHTVWDDDEWLILTQLTNSAFVTQICQGTKCINLCESLVMCPDSQCIVWFLLRRTSRSNVKRRCLIFKAQTLCLSVLRSRTFLRIILNRSILGSPHNSNYTFNNIVIAHCLESH